MLGSDRIFFSPSVVTALPDDQIYAAFLKRSESLGAPVLIVHSPAQMKQLRERGQAHAESSQSAQLVAQLPAAGKIPFQLVRYTPNHLDIDVTAPADGWVLVTDRWCRGWNATVNGQDVPVYGGDFVFRAVQVHAGHNKINFDYRPAGWPTLLWLSWVTLAATFIGPRLKLRSLIVKPR
jgi:hypothetical protein